MREVEVTILDRNSSAGSTVTIQFETVNEFAEKVIAFEKSLSFFKTYIEFDTDDFDEGELDFLSEEAELI